MQQRPVLFNASPTNIKFMKEQRVLAYLKYLYPSGKQQQFRQKGVEHALSLPSTIRVLGKDKDMSLASQQLLNMKLNQNNMQIIKTSVKIPSPWEHVRHFLKPNYKQSQIKRIRLEPQFLRRKSCECDLCGKCTILQKYAQHLSNSSDKQKQNTQQLDDSLNTIAISLSQPHNETQNSIIKMGKPNYRIQTLTYDQTPSNSINSPKSMRNAQKNLQQSMFSSQHRLEHKHTRQKPIVSTHARMEHVLLNPFALNRSLSPLLKKLCLKVSPSMKVQHCVTENIQNNIKFKGNKPNEQVKKYVCYANFGARIQKSPKAIVKNKDFIVNV